MTSARRPGHVGKHRSNHKSKASKASITGKSYISSPGALGRNDRADPNLDDIDFLNFSPLGRGPLGTAFGFAIRQWWNSGAAAQLQLFNTCTVATDKLSEVTAIVTAIVANKSRYETVTATLGTMPWWFVALIHSLEASLQFTKHLHNGDPLTDRTKHVPAGRPIANPTAHLDQDPSVANPYTWEESAADALVYEGFGKWKDWSIGGALEKLEEYNGLGYRKYHSNVHSPYLWSYTDLYTAGKYASDGKWNAALVSKQAGAAAILRVMVDTKVI